MQLRAAHACRATARARPGRVSSVAARPVSRQARRTVAVRAELKQQEGVEVDKLVQDLQEKWDKVENKTGVLLYGAGALTALWFANTIIGAINSVPLLPKLMELVGLGYTAWFTYRYLLFKSNREELVKDVDELKKKITGGDL